MTENKLSDESILDAARESDLLFNEELGTEIAKDMHKQKLLKYAKLIMVMYSSEEHKP